MRMLSLRLETCVPVSRVALTAVLVWALVLGPGMTAAQEKSDGQKAARAKAAQKPANANVPESEGAKGPQEGIKVHGHWVIEVRNPDGTVATRREFENAYVPSALLPRILARIRTPEFWFVDIYSELNTSPCTGSPTGFSACIIGEGSGYSDEISSNLSVSLTSGLQGIVLSGSVTALSNGTIDQVKTLVADCPPNLTPATPCPLGTQRSVLTQTASPSISVAAGQVIQVTVTITFS